MDTLQKYEKLIYRNNKTERAGKLIDGTPMKKPDEVRGVGFRGACQIPGAKFNIGGGLVTEPVFIDPYPHKHPSEEHLAFLGRPGNPFDFDADIEFTLGLEEDGDAELFYIDRPTIVRVPAGVWHCPLNFIRIGKPVFFQVSLAQGMFGGTYRMPDGVQELSYNGKIDCVLEPEKECSCCGKCLSVDWKG